MTIKISTLFHHTAVYVSLSIHEKVFGFTGTTLKRYNPRTNKYYAAEKCAFENIQASSTPCGRIVPMKKGWGVRGWRAKGEALLLPFVQIQWLHCGFRGSLCHANTGIVVLFRGPEIHTFSPVRFSTMGAFH